MPAGIDRINFEFSEDWELIADRTRTATIINENSHTPIPAFDLGVTVNDDYVAVIVISNTAKPNWFLAGDIAQVYDFAKGGSNPLLGKIEPNRTRLALNRLQLVETNRVSTDPFRLRYAPVAWLKDCAIRVYKYVGQKDNFVEDTLFDIGNALGIDPNNPDGKLVLALLRIEDLIKETEERLCAKIDALNGGSGTDGGSFGFDISGGGNFQSEAPSDNIGFSYYQGFL